MTPTQSDVSRYDMRREREGMVRRQLGSIADRRVLEAMARVPRHLFVPEDRQHAAYADHPLPIGHGQTISQPLMVATMLEAAELRASDRVLDVGAGSGYQAAVLSMLVRHVYAVELIPELACTAARNLERVGITNTTVLVGDGSRGAPAHAPFDAIIVAASARRVPQALVDQLIVGGRLVIPVMARSGDVLQRITKLSDGTRTESICGCRFVPLIADEDS